MARFRARSCKGTLGAIIAGVLLLGPASAQSGTCDNDNFSRDDLIDIFKSFDEGKATPAAALAAIACAEKLIGIKEGEHVSIQVGQEGYLYCPSVVKAWAYGKSDRYVESAEALKAASKSTACTNRYRSKLPAIERLVQQAKANWEQTQIATMKAALQGEITAAESVLAWKNPVPSGLPEMQKFEEELHRRAVDAARDLKTNIANRGEVLPCLDGVTKPSELKTCLAGPAAVALKSRLGGVTSDAAPAGGQQIVRRLLREQKFTTTVKLGQLEDCDSTRAATGGKIQVPDGWSVADWSDLLASVKKVADSNKQLADCVRLEGLAEQELKDQLFIGINKTRHQNEAVCTSLAALRPELKQLATIASRLCGPPVETGNIEQLDRAYREATESITPDIERIRTSLVQRRVAARSLCVQAHQETLALDASFTAIQSASTFLPLKECDDRLLQCEQGWKYPYTQLAAAARRVADAVPKSLSNCTTTPLSQAIGRLESLTASATKPPNADTVKSAVVSEWGRVNTCANAVFTAHSQDFTSALTKAKSIAVAGSAYLEGLHSPLVEAMQSWLQTISKNNDDGGTARLPNPGETEDWTAFAGTWLTAFEVQNSLRGGNPGALPDEARKYCVAAALRFVAEKLDAGRTSDLQRATDAIASAQVNCKLEDAGKTSDALRRTLAYFDAYAKWLKAGRPARDAEIARLVVQSGGAVRNYDPRFERAFHVQ